MTARLVLGGARSGKSRHGEEWVLAQARGRACIYIATGQAFDGEMAERIARHRAERDPAWHTVEAPLDVSQAIGAHCGAAVLVDCLTLWLSNLLLADRDCGAARQALLAAVAAHDGPIALVANEVGLGIVPDNVLARRFRDEAGWLNQSLAAQVDQVAFLVAGLPLMLKG